MHIKLRQTLFQVEPLKNVVGVGDTTAFQIVVTPGAELGTLGMVHVPACAEIGNDSPCSNDFVPRPRYSLIRSLVASGCRSVLATFKTR